MSKVYLCGPITGLSYDGATDWRDYAKNRLAFVDHPGGRSNSGIFGYSPMRAKDYLSHLTEISSDPKDYPTAYMSVLSSGRGITERDRWDVRTADLLLANFLGATAVSVGSVIELGWADAFRTPVVIAMEEGNVHEHAILDELYGWRVDNLDEALDVTKAILLP